MRETGEERKSCSERVLTVRELFPAHSDRALNSVRNCLLSMEQLRLPSCTDKSLHCQSCFYLVPAS